MKFYFPDAVLKNIVRNGVEGEFPARVSRMQPESKPNSCGKSQLHRRFPFANYASPHALQEIYYFALFCTVANFIGFHVHKDAVGEAHLPNWYHLFCFGLQNTAQ